MWNATVLSLFPEMFPGTLDFSIAGKALRKNLWSLKTVNIRQFSNNKNGFYSLDADSGLVNWKQKINNRLRNEIRTA